MSDDILSNPVVRSLRAHRSIRRFTAEPVSDETLNALIETAQRSSTSSNLQCYSVIVVRDPERKRRIALLCGNQQQIIDAPVFLAHCADLNRARLVCEQAGYRFEAKFVELLLLSVIDVTIFAQTLLSAAEGIGLGGCYIGAARNHPFELAEVLGLPPLVFAVFGMTLGHPDPAHQPPLRPRLPLAGVIHHETYDDARWTEAHRAYDRAMRETGIYKGRQIDLSKRLPGWSRVIDDADYGWIEHSARRWIDPAGFRADIRPFLDRQGFGFD
ncbi:MAG TPA: NADPH-dependent oxidoreductase [bacterium]|nr:NADPH-dependent oxidoreductase [bacterium]